MIIAFESTGHNAAMYIFFDLCVKTAAINVASDPKIISVSPKPPKKFETIQPASNPGIASGM